jgi:hypothetical protein
MATISAQEVYQILSHRYPNADVFVLDEEYDLPERSEIVSLYDKFQRALKLHKLLKWTESVWDCDDFAWSFKGGANGHRATKRAKRSLPVGFLCFLQGGEENGGHAINNTIWRDGNGSLIREIEPQPGGGIQSLTDDERKSAWLVIV